MAGDRLDASLRGARTLITIGQELYAISGELKGENGRWLAALRCLDAGMKRAACAPVMGRKKRMRKSGGGDEGHHAHAAETSSMLPPTEEATVRVQCAILLITRTHNVSDATKHVKRALMLLDNVRKAHAYIELKLKAYAVAAAANRLGGNTRAAKQALQQGRAAAEELLNIRLTKLSHETGGTVTGNDDGDARDGLAAAAAWCSYFVIEVASLLRSDGELRSAIEMLNTSVTDMATRVRPVFEAPATAPAMADVDASFAHIVGSNCRLLLCKYQLLIDSVMQVDLSGGIIHSKASVPPTLSSVAANTAADVAATERSSFQRDVENLAACAASLTAELERLGSFVGTAADVDCDRAALSCHFHLLQAVVAVQGGRIEEADTLVRRAEAARASASDRLATMSHRNVIATPGTDPRSMAVLMKVLRQLINHCAAHKSSREDSATVATEGGDGAVQSIDELMLELVPGLDDAAVSAKRGALDSAHESHLNSQTVWLARMLLPLHVLALSQRCIALLVGSDVIEGQKVLERVVSACQRFPTLLGQLSWLPMYMCGIYLLRMGLNHESVSALASASAVAHNTNSSVRFAVAAMYATSLALAATGEDNDTKRLSQAVAILADISKAASSSSAASSMSASISMPCLPLTLDSYSTCAVQLGYALLNSRRASVGLAPIGNSGGLRRALKLSHKSLRNQQLTAVCLTLLGDIEMGGKGNAADKSSADGVKRSGNLKDSVEYFKSASTLSRHLRDLPTFIVACDGLAAAHAALHAQSHSDAEPLPDACVTAAQQANRKREEVNGMHRKAILECESHSRIMGFVSENAHM